MVDPTESTFPMLIMQKRAPGRKRDYHAVRQPLMLSNPAPSQQGVATRDLFDDCGGVHTYLWSACASTHERAEATGLGRLA